MSAPDFELRLFVALWPHPELAAAMAVAARGLAPGSRLVPGAKLHMTLAFIGRLPRSRQQQCLEALGQVECPPFRLQLDRLGYWSHNELLWLAPSSPCPECSRLATAVAASLRHAGIALDPRPFRAHVTLARKCPRNLRPYPPLALTWAVDAFRLVQSKLLASGSEYVCAHQWPLT